MLDQMKAIPTPQKRLPWNKGKLTGAKPPLRPKHVWSIRTKLQIEGRVRDLAMFNLAIDSMLRACDLAKLRLDDICSGTKVRASSDDCSKEDRSTSPVRNHGAVEELR